jgi:glycosyltransferase involved in cell wall biosynthesis
MGNPLISVIVPVYKVEQYLHTCIESVLNQTYSNWELILVDDGSPDNCPQICDEYAAKDIRIKVIHKKNGGLSSARNAGLDIAKGDHMSFLDSDDFWSKDYLTILLNLCIKYDADIVQCGFIRGTETVFPNITIGKGIKTFDNHSIFLKGYAKIIVCAKLYRKCLISEIRMPEGKINEDDFTTWKFYYRAKKILVTNQSLYYYTVNENSIMASQSKMPRLDFIEAYKERIEFFQKNRVKDLEDFSRGHLCKSLLLTSKNPMLSAKQKKIVDTTFLSNWKLIRCSGNVAFSLRVLFLMFRIIPKTTLRLVNLVR